MISIFTRIRRTTHAIMFRSRTSPVLVIGFIFATLLTISHGLNTTGCHAKTTDDQFEVRVVNGNKASEGRVEVHYQGRWGRICLNGWGYSEALVVCRMLGYSTTNVRAIRSAYFGTSSGDVLLHGLTCRGSERSLGSCFYEPVGDGSCWYGIDAGVDCDPDPVQVRLVNGSTPHRGRVEILYKGQWGTVCHDTWGYNGALVICRMLGYRTTTVRGHGAAFFGQGSGEIIMQRPFCDGNEVSIDVCSNLWWGGNVCSHDADVGVDCQPEPLRVRLANGSTAHRGRVEIHYNGQWGTVCDSNWDYNDALVVCRMLGYNTTNVRAPRSAFYGRGTGEVVMHDARCRGDESSLEYCYSVQRSRTYCTHYQDASVDCSPEPLRVRLVNGSTHFEGRVEVYLHGRWGTVCNDDWDYNDALVVCRMLFNSTSDVRAFGSRLFARGSRATLMGSVRCSGKEPSLEYCSSAPWSSALCLFDAAVDCASFSDPVLQARLINGKTPDQGTVEVLYKGQWGTVCDHNWDYYDALVVCRMLGFRTSNVRALGSAFFGPGSGTIWLGDVRCKGSEFTLDHCPSPKLGSYSCQHTRDAGVDCNPDPVQIRLRGGKTSHQGRVEFSYHGRWGTVCDSGWNYADALVVCHMLGYSTTNVRALRAAFFGQGSGEIWLDNVSCRGSETTLDVCSHSRWVSNNCKHSSDAGVDCNPAPVEVRLLNGNTLYQGRVEVLYHEQWGRVCDLGWDNSDARVVCRMLGFSNSSARALRSAFFGQGTGAWFIKDVRCRGNEPSLEDCSADWGGRYPDSCGQSGDASVDCDPDPVKVRLVNGSHPHQGRVEISYQGRWGTVSDNSWGYQDALVICKMLGYNTTNVRALGSAFFGQGTGEVFLDTVECTGNELSLEDCHSDTWSHSYFGHSNDAGVDCYPGYFDPPFRSIEPNTGTPSNVPISSNPSQFSTSTPVKFTGSGATDQGDLCTQCSGCMRPGPALEENNTGPLYAAAVVGGFAAGVLLTLAVSALIWYHRKRSVGRTVTEKYTPDHGKTDTVTGGDTEHFQQNHVTSDDTPSTTINGHVYEGPSGYAEPENTYDQLRRAVYDNNIGSDSI